LALIFIIKEGRFLYPTLKSANQLEHYYLEHKIKSCLSDSNSPVHKCHKGNYKNQSVQCGVPHSGLCVSLTTIRPELGVLRGEWTVYEVSYRAFDCPPKRFCAGASVNTKSGFSIITYTGQTASGSIAHGLGQEPKFIITKVRSGGAQSWGVYHKDVGINNYLLLDSTGAT